MGVRKVSTTSYHIINNKSGNGGVERVNHALAQILALMVCEQQDDWGWWLPYIGHIEFVPPPSMYHEL